MDKDCFIFYVKTDNICPDIAGMLKQDLVPEIMDCYLKELPKK